MHAIDPLWSELALTPPRAAGSACGSARLRVAIEDFIVEEQLGFEPSGAGEHLLLKLRKRDANTGWVARELAARAGVRPFEVGYAGLKDRRALTTQWFTVPRRKSLPAEWIGFAGAGFEVLEAHVHSRKLPRGALAGNRFSLLLRDVTADRAELEARFAMLAKQGVPNYFGPQRFGRQLANLVAVQRCLTGEPLPRDERQRGFVFSAARSLVFNAVLAERIRRGDWTQLHPGERANLDGSNSTFLVEAVDATIEARLAALDIHPTGLLPGVGDATALEEQVLARFANLQAWLAGNGVEAARRPLRIAVRDLALEFVPEGLRLQFSLRAGSFATAVVREVFEVDAAAGEEDA